MTLLQQFCFLNIDSTQNRKVLPFPRTIPYGTVGSEVSSKFDRMIYVLQKMYLLMNIFQVEFKVLVVTLKTCMASPRPPALRGIQPSTEIGNRGYNKNTAVEGISASGTLVSSFSKMAILWNSLLDIRTTLLHFQRALKSWIFQRLNYSQV